MTTDTESARCISAALLDKHPGAPLMAFLEALNTKGSEGLDVALAVTRHHRCGLEGPATVGDTNARTFGIANGASPLMLAAHSGRLDVVQALQAAGANVNATDLRGRTPLHMACINKQDRIISELLASGANVNAKDREEVTPLHKASTLGLGAVVALLAYGADVNALDEEGSSPLHWVAQVGGADDLLLDAGVDLEARDSEGQTALHIVAACNSIDRIALLVAEGANTQAQEVRGQTPLQGYERYAQLGNPEATNEWVRRLLANRLV